MQNSKKGFTILELVIVIAILAILAASVSINMIPYVNKGRDAVIKADLMRIRLDAFYYFDVHRSYNGFTDNTVINAINKLGGVAKIIIPNSGKTYCAVSKLVVDKTDSWCVSSSGFVGEGTCVAGACVPMP